MCVAHCAVCHVLCVVVCMCLFVLPVVVCVIYIGFERIVYCWLFVVCCVLLVDWCLFCGVLFVVCWLLVDGMCSVVVLCC